jgi:5-methyltetrahydrofolate--homocysteine methyltransferase
MKVIRTLPLAELTDFIDWSPFFHTWELRGRYPEILANSEAKKLFQDAERLLAEILRDGSLVAKGVYGIFPANSIGDDVEVYTDATRQQVLTRFHFLRQQMDKPPGQHNHCLADYIAPKEGAPLLKDHIGGFAVSAGFGTEELCAKFERDHDDYNSIMAKALADRLAEAFAEYLHREARVAWGFGRNEGLTREDLIREKYRGIRPAAGYPACPDHTEKRTLWRLLQVEENTGIRLTESCAMWPGASVSGLYFAHPEAKYFGVGKLGQDQVKDYQQRKGVPLTEVERWLGPWLDYDPQPGK